jgi:hypothetical protein
MTYSSYEGWHPRVNPGGEGSIDGFKVYAACTVVLINIMITHNPRTYLHQADVII